LLDHGSNLWVAGEAAAVGGKEPMGILFGEA
jgi:hypothetical protein